MANRCQFGNLAANHQLYAHRLPRPFENKPPRQTDFNLFIQANYGRGPVFLKHGQVLSGACVLSPYQFTRGSLPSIVCSVVEPVAELVEASDGPSTGSGSDLVAELVEAKVLVTNLSLGNLVITELTTVAEFSQALIDNNSDWREGDELSFFHAVQIIDAYLEVPRARMNSCHLVLDTTDTELLYNIVTPTGFTSVVEPVGEPVEPPVETDGPSTGSGTDSGADSGTEAVAELVEAPRLLGMNAPLVNAGAAWVHSRKRADSTIRVSTQYLYVVSDILADYQSEAAYTASAESYGVQSLEPLNTLNP